MSFRMVYDPETNERIGLVDFPEVQIDLLGYEPLEKKISRFLNGNGDLKADDRELEYDQDEGEWTDEDPEMDPLNDISVDEVDVLDMQRDLNERINEASKMVQTKVTQGDTPEQSVEVKETKEEK